MRDDEPAVWVVVQEYVGPDGVARRRDGLVASLRVEPYETGTVLPHERTHAGPKESRLRLLRAARAQLEPIFLLYDGVPPVCGSGARARPGHRGYARSGASRATASPRRSPDRQLLIADGHHRYETAVAYAAEEGTPESARMMVVLVSTSDPGLEIFPTHRLFRGHEQALPPVRASVGDSAFTAAAVTRLASLPYDRAQAVGYRKGVTFPVVGEPGELDVELVDRLVGHEELGYTADLGRGGRPRRLRRVRRGVPAPRDPDRGRIRARAPRRGDAAEDDVLLPQADERPALPPCMTRRLAQPLSRPVSRTSMSSSPSCRPGQSGSRCSDGVRVATTRRRSTRLPRTRSSPDSRPSRRISSSSPRSSASAPSGRADRRASSSTRSTDR